MQKILVYTFLSLVMISLTSGLAQAQEKSRFSLSFERDQLRNFRIDNQKYNESRSYTFRFSFFDEKYTNIEYGLHHTRGYNESVTYSFGLSAAYVLPITEDIVLKPGISFDAFKLKDRKCTSFMKSIVGSVFGMNNAAEYDQHTSFTPQITAEISISKPMSVFFRSDYRFMHSIVKYERDVNDTNPDGEQTKVNGQKSETDHSFYGAGIGFGAGLRYNF